MAPHTWLLQAVEGIENQPPQESHPNHYNAAEEAAPTQTQTEHSWDTSSEASLSDMSNSSSQSPLGEYGPSTEQLEAHVKKQHRETGGKSTHKQYYKLLLEYNDFSNALFNDETITVDRVFRFMQFQAHRELRNNKPEEDDLDPVEMMIRNNDKKRKRGKRKRGGGNKTGNTRATRYKFDVKEYQQVMDHIQDDIEGKDISELPFWNRVKNVAKYHQAMIWFADEKTKPLLRSNHSIKLLVRNVQARAKMMAVNSSDQALCRVTEKFKYPELYKKTEDYLWNEYKTGNNLKKLTRSLRDRYTLLMSVQTCTRHEATLSCKLSSFDVCEQHITEELEPYSILTRCIYKGKTNQEDSVTILQAKSIRHKHVHLCEQGALAMYLFARFRVHDEDFDVTNTKIRNNKKAWTHVRTTVGVSNSRKQFEDSRLKPMASGTYYSCISDIFKFFGYNVSHVIHFGRACSPVLLEFASVLTQAIEMLGDWNQDKYRKSYSLNLPWDALRAAAGFPKKIGCYRLPRNKLPVDQQLKALVFPNITRARNLFGNLPEHYQFQLPLAKRFLSVMDYLSQVFIQDVCALRADGRDVHQLYMDPLFQHPLFTDYEGGFREVYTYHIDPRNDPTLDPIRVAAPHMANHLGDLKSFTYQGLQSLNRQVNAVNMQNQSILNAIQAHHLYVANVIGSAMQAGYQAHVSSPSRPFPNRPADDSVEETLPTQLTTTINPGGHEPTQQCAEKHPNFPPFDRLCYDGIEQIFDDWFGEAGSPYEFHGGIKALYANKAWRKSLGNDALKREADKKMLQKIKRIGDFMEHRMDGGLSKVQCQDLIRDLLDTHPNFKETLTGIDKVIKLHVTTSI